MIRIAHISDSHFHEPTRLQDCVDVHRAFLKQARAAEVDLIVHSGDVFERKSTPAERRAVADWVQEAASVAPVAIVRGNHDVPGDLHILGRLESENSIRVFERPRVEVYSALGFGIIALPWFDKSHLIAQIPAEVGDQESTRNRTIAAAKQLLDHLRAQVRLLRCQTHGSEVVPILVGHVMVAGSETSTGQTLQGTTVELSPSDIRDVGCTYAALGHIHKAQGWYDGAVAYAGSPRRHNFGEGEAKGWRLVEIEGGKLRSSQFMKLPARRIVLLEVDYTRGERMTRELLEHEVVTGDLVRVRYKIAPEHLHEVDEAQLAEMVAQYGAAEVKLEAVLAHETRVRSAEIVDAASTWQKLVAYFRAKDTDLSDSLVERLKGKLAILEGGDDAAE